MPPAPPIVVVISSQVASGMVGGRVSQHILQTMGCAVWFVPTVAMNWHPGIGPAQRRVSAAADLRASFDDLLNHPAGLRPAAVLSGYMGAAEQVAVVRDYIDAAKAADPALRYFCDPVIGDHGRVYVGEKVAAAIRDQLLPLADIAAPNRFELGWLSGDTDNEALIAQADQAAALGPAEVLVTSASAFMRGSTAVLQCLNGRAVLAEHRAVAASPHGAGDAFAACYLARMLRGEVAGDALQRAAASVSELLAHTGDGALALEGNGAALMRPQAPVSLRQVSLPRRSK